LDFYAIIIFLNTKESIMSDYTLTPQKIREFRSELDREAVLYQWVQENKITLDDFRTLLDENQLEHQRQIDLDSFD
jgi:uncharacterized membrane protein YgaE (UPF0421/DUF939 family)